MREVVEYAVGIFRGSIMAIQSGGARVEFVVSAWRRAAPGRGLSGRERSPGESGDVLSNVLSIHPAGIPVGVFFPFPGNRTEKGA